MRRDPRDESDGHPNGWILCALFPLSFALATLLRYLFGPFPWSLSW